MFLITSTSPYPTFGATREGTRLIGTDEHDFIHVGYDDLPFLDSVEALGGDDKITLYDYRGRPLELFGGDGFDSLTIVPDFAIEIVVTAIVLDNGGILWDGLAITTYDIESVRVAKKKVGFVGSDQDDRFFAEGWHSTHLKGGEGNDTLEGTGQYSRCYGGNGDDHLTVTTRGRVDGGDGVDTFSLNGFHNPHVITLRNGNGWARNMQSDWRGMDKRLVNIENLEGGSSHDIIRGDAGGNVLNGAGDNDWIEGRGGNDTLLGGSGGDTFLFGRGDGKDTVLDLERGDHVKFAEGLIDPTLSAAEVLRHYGRWTEAGYLLDFGQTEILFPDLSSIRLLEQALVIL